LGRSPRKSRGKGVRRAQTLTGGPGTIGELLTANQRELNKAIAEVRSDFGVFTAIKSAWAKFAADLKSGDSVWFAVEAQS
jgi:hypothetical protein